MVIFDPGALQLDVSSLGFNGWPKRILMVRPDFFQVEYVINAHMDGRVGSVDPERALAQWTALADTYRKLGVRVDMMDAVEGLPDLVFCANQMFPFRQPDGRGAFVLGRMHAPQRRPEVALLARHVTASGLPIHHLGLPENILFEGTGDAIWHADRALVWGGYGFRTDVRAYRSLSDVIGVPIVALRLVDPMFYHLDTCLCVLDGRTALIAPAAFDAVGRGLLETLFERVFEVPDSEARSGFACNAHCPDGRHVLIQRGNPITCEWLGQNGYRPIELDTDEFIKSGGSVFCMKLATW